MADNFNKLFQIDALKAEQEQAVALVREWIKEVSKASEQARIASAGLLDKNSLETLHKQTKETTKAAAEHQKVTEQSALATKRLADAELKLAKAREVNARVEDKTVKALAREEKMLADLNNDYKLLGQAYSEAAIKAKNYQLVLGKNHPVAQQAVADAKAMSDTLKGLDASVGQFGRNVGNYNMVGSQFNQLLRELPNAGLSLQTFLISISNNFTYFAEAVKVARAEGQSWKQIIGGLGASLFSVVGVASLVVTGVLLMTKAFGENKKQAKAMAEEMTDAQKVIKDFASITAKETTELHRLYDVSTDVTRSTEERTAAVDELQKMYPAYFGNMKDEAILAGDARMAYMELTTALIASARARAMSNRLTELSEKELAINERLAEIAKERAAANQQGQGDTFVMQSLEEAGKLVKMREEGVGLEKELQGIIAKKLDYSKQISDQSAIEAKFKREIVKTEKEGQAARATFKLPNAPDNMDAWAAEILGTTEVVSSVLQDKMLEEAERLRMLEESYAAGLMSHEEYQKGKEKIAREVTTKILELQIAEMKSMIQYGNLTKQQITELENKIAGLTHRIGELNNEAGGEGGKSRMKEGLKAVRDFSDALGEVSKFQSKMSQNRIAAIESEREVSDDAAKLEIERIEHSLLSEEEKAEKIDAITTNQHNNNQRLRQQEAQERRRQAVFEKTIAVSQAIIGTSLAVIEKGVTTPLAIAAGIAGAAQIATILATPIPEYADGTDNHKRGPAIVGEAGEPELVKEPGKAAYWVTSPTLFKDLPGGTQVKPLHDLLAVGNGMLTPGLIGSLRASGGFDTKALEQGLRRVEQAIQSQPIPSLEIDHNGAFRKSVKVGNYTQNWIKRNIID